MQGNVDTGWASKIANRVQLENLAICPTLPIDAEFGRDYAIEVGRGRTVANTSDQGNHIIRRRDYS